MTSEEPTQRPALHTVSLKGPVKYEDKARHGDLAVQTKRTYKNIPCSEKRMHVNISSESLENPQVCPLCLPNVPQFGHSASLCGYQSAFFFTEFVL